MSPISDGPRTRLYFNDGWSRDTLVELVRLYSNPAGQGELLRRMVGEALTARPAEVPRHPRQRQRRLSLTETAELIMEYERKVPVKDLANSLESTV